MSSMRSAAILDLRVTNPYYADGLSDDVVIEPGEQAVAAMRSLRLHWKAFGSGYRMLATLDGKGKPFASIPQPRTFDFLLRARNPDLVWGTDLAPLSALPAPVFTNVGVVVETPAVLRLTTRTAQATAVLTVVAPGEREAFVLAQRPLSGTGAGAVTVEPAGVVAVAALDPANGWVTVDSRGRQPGDRFSLTYPVPRPRLPNALAEVEMALDDGLLKVGLSANPPPRFEIRLGSPVGRWVYYLVADQAGPTGALRIVDADPSGAPARVRFSDAGRTDLSAQPDAGDRVAADLAERNPGRRILRFMSDAVVACRQAPVRTLGLYAGETRLIDSLPNPSPRRSALLPAAAPSPVFYAVLTVVAS